MKVDETYLLGNITYFDEFIERILIEENAFLETLNAGSKYFLAERSENKVLFDNKATSIPYKILKNIVDYKIYVTLEKEQILVKANPIESDNIKKLWIKMFLESNLAIENYYFLFDLLEKINYFLFNPNINSTDIKDFLNKIDYKKVIIDKIEQGKINKLV